MGDELSKRDPRQVAGFYNRLADSVEKNKGGLQTSMSATLMRHWLANRDPKSLFEFEAPDHLKTNKKVLEALKYHREVYLTQKKARFTGGTEKWAGILPRLQGKPPYSKWNGTGVLNLEYESLVELSLLTQLTGSDAERDLLYGLHGFQLKSKVSVTVSPIKGNLRVAFASFEAAISDRYDWDYSEHFTVPNPDYGSKSPDAVDPDSKTVTVYHSNAARLEKAALAAPYNLQSKWWRITDLGIAGPAEVDPKKKL